MMLPPMAGGDSQPAMTQKPEHNPPDKLPRGFGEDLGEDDVILHSAEGFSLSPMKPAVTSQAASAAPVTPVKRRDDEAEDHHQADQQNHPQLHQLGQQQQQQNGGDSAKARVFDTGEFVGQIMARVEAQRERFGGKGFASEGLCLLFLLHFCLQLWLSRA